MRKLLNCSASRHSCFVEDRFLGRTGPVTLGEVVLGTHIPLIGCQPKPAYRFRSVFRDAFAIGVHSPE